MGKRKKHQAAAREPREDPGLLRHCHPTTSTPPEPKRRQPRDPAPGAGAGSDSEPDPSPPSSPDSVRRLLEPYSRPRLLVILADAAASDPTLRARLTAAADASPSHRWLFVHGLPPRADAAALADAFSRFGPLADAGCRAVADRATGRRCRGYGFVSFASRAAALRALRESPAISVAGSPVSAQFASAGPDGGGGGAGRRVYVTNVAPDAGAERLRAFFVRFGELEGGPFGFDAGTGRSLGYALFVYRAAAGAAKAVEEPYRVFDGRTLHCQLANEPARKTKALPETPPAAMAGTPPPVVAVAATPVLKPVLDAIEAAGVEDLARYARDPVKAAALLGQNPALAAAALSSALASAAAASWSPEAAVVAPTPAAVSAAVPVAVATGRPAATAAVVPSPVKFGVGPSGGAGLLGPYRPPSSAVSSSPGRE